jgi:hypothetical protein
VDAIAALLDRAKAAHGVYEETELDGVYDEQWPAWYGAWIVDHGLGELLGHRLGRAEVGDYLARAWDDFRALSQQPAESWTTWTAGRLAAEL